MGLYLEGHPRKPRRLLIPTVWAWDDLYVPTLPVPQFFFPSPKSKCNIDKDVCISFAMASLRMGRQLGVGETFSHAKANH